MASVFVDNIIGVPVVLPTFSRWTTYTSGNTVLPAGLVTQYRQEFSVCRIRVRGTTIGTSSSSWVIGYPPGVTNADPTTNNLSCGYAELEDSVSSGLVFHGSVNTNGSTGFNVKRSGDPSSANATWGNTTPVSFAASAGFRLYIELSFESAEFMLTQYTTYGSGSSTGGSSAGGLQGVLASSNVALGVISKMYECTSTGGFQINLPPIPPGGGSIGVMDAGETFSATNYVDIIANGTDTINGYVAGDIIRMDYSKAWVVFYAAPGATSWKIQSQSVALPQGGQIPGGNGASAIGAGFIGQNLSGFSAAASCTSNAYRLLVSRVLTDGFYLVGGQAGVFGNVAAFSGGGLQVLSITDSGTVPSANKAEMNGDVKNIAGLSQLQLSISSFYIRVYLGLIYYPDGTVSTSNTINLHHYCGSYTSGPPTSGGTFTIVRVG